MFNWPVTMRKGPQGAGTGGTRLGARPPGPGGPGQGAGTGGTRLGARPPGTGGRDRGHGTRGGGRCHGLSSPG